MVPAHHPHGAPCHLSQPVCASRRFLEATEQGGGKKKKTKKLCTSRAELKPSLQRGQGTDGILSPRTSRGCIWFVGGGEGRVGRLPRTMQGGSSAGGHPGTAPRGPAQPLVVGGRGGAAPKDISASVEAAESCSGEISTRSFLLSERRRMMTDCTCTTRPAST